MAMDKLTIEQVEEGIKDCDNRYIIFELRGEELKSVLQQLADTMRENEKLWSALNYIAVGEDVTVEKLIGDWEKFNAMHPNKDAGKK